MKVITKYISKQIVSIFLLVHFIIILLYLVIDFIQKIDNFAEAEVSLSLTLFYFLYKIPTIIMQITPAAVMISIVAVICQMKKNREVMAMKACGLNLYKVFQPVIVISLLISFFSFLLAEMVVPSTSSKSNEIMEIEVKKRSQANFREWYKSENAIYRIPHFDEETKTINDPVFYFFDDQFNIIKKINGESSRWTGDAWEVKDAKILTLPEDGADPYTVEKSSYLLEIDETPETFKTIRRKPEDMTYKELRKRAEKIKAEGYDNTKDMVNLHMKFSYPFLCVVFALIAVPLGLWEKTDAIPLSITIGILGIFLCWSVMSYSRALGWNGTLPPILAAWTANILFTFTGIYLLMHIKK